MNFSSSLMSGMGISLGGLEIATDFLYANPDFYEPELTEIKTTISNKPKESVQKNVKTVKPKVTRETIINKFSLIKTKTTLVSDEVLDNSSLVREVDDFDFSFDTNVTAFDTQEDIEANNIMQKIESSKGCTLNNSFKDIDDTDEKLEIDTENYAEDNAEDDIDSFDDVDSLDFEDNNIVEDDDASLDDIDSLDFDETDLDEDEDDNNSFDDIDSLELDENGDEEDNSDSFSIDDLDNIDDIDLEDDETDLDEDEQEEYTSDSFSLDDLDIEEDLSTSPEIKDNNIDNEELDISLDDLGLELEDEASNNTELNDSTDSEFSIDDIDLGDLDLEDSTPKHTKSVMSEKTVREKQVDNNNASCENTYRNKDMDMLKDRISNVEKQMQSLTADRSSKNTSELKKKDFNLDNNDSLDTLLKGNKPKNTKDISGSRYDKYTVLNVDQLYTYVKNYMIQKGLHKNTIDISVLNERFGEANIKKLIQKSYLIKIGKGVTTGR